MNEAKIYKFKNNFVFQERSRLLWFRNPTPSFLHLRVVAKIVFIVLFLRQKARINLSDLFPLKRKGTFQNLVYKHRKGGDLTNLYSLT